MSKSGAKYLNNQATVAAAAAVHSDHPPDQLSSSSVCFQ